MADTADLVVLGAYIGTGNKGSVATLWSFSTYPLWVWLKSSLILNNPPPPLYWFPQFYNDTRAKFLGFLKFYIIETSPNQLVLVWRIEMKLTMDSFCNFKKLDIRTLSIFYSLVRTRLKWSSIVSKFHCFSNYLEILF